MVVVREGALAKAALSLKSKELLRETYREGQRTFVLVRPDSALLRGFGIYQVRKLLMKSTDMMDDVYLGFCKNGNESVYAYSRERATAKAPQQETKRSAPINDKTKRTPKQRTTAAPLAASGAPGPPPTASTTKVKPTQTRRAEPQALRLSELVPLPARQSAPEGSRGVTMHLYLA